jgi:hypothetical protein
MPDVGDGARDSHDVQRVLLAPHHDAPGDVIPRNVGGLLGGYPAGGMRPERQTWHAWQVRVFASHCRRRSRHWCQVLSCPAPDAMHMPAPAVCC